MLDQPPLPSPHGEVSDDQASASAPPPQTWPQPRLLTATSASSGASNDRVKPPILLLLDMNGTLLYRSKSLIEGPSVPPPSLLHGDLFYYFRPWASELVRFALGHPRVRVAFYTSMRGSNAMPAVQYLTPPGSPVPEVYDRPFNVPDPAGINSWDTIRDMEKVWAAVGRVGEGFGPQDTLMVDDSPRKLRHMPGNTLIVPNFNEVSVEKEAVSQAVGGEGKGGMGCLWWLQVYLGWVFFSLSDMPEGQGKAQRFSFVCPLGKGYLLSQGEPFHRQRGGGKYNPRPCIWCLSAQENWIVPRVVMAGAFVFVLLDTPKLFCTKG
ncbi:unnamed protein product [Discosporangium mesarthrocarpum]